MVEYVPSQLTTDTRKTTEEPLDQIILRTGSFIGPPTQGKPGKWCITKKLGEGGMGAVYEAETVDILRRVALKVVPSTTGDHLARFKREVRNLGQLEHPNIVSIIDAGEHLESGKIAMAYMVMEKLSGHDFETELELQKETLAVTNSDWRMTRTLEEICVIMGKFAHAIASAHSIGILHRDIKPSNLFLALQPDGSIIPKLIDFGIAGVVEGSRKITKLTVDGSIFGTPHYMAPEQILGEGDVGPPADVFALVSVLYELVTGVIPYNPPSLVGISAVGLLQLRLESMKKGVEPWIERLPITISDRLKTLFRRGLEPNREYREKDMYMVSVALYDEGKLPFPLAPAHTMPSSDLEPLELKVSKSDPGGHTTHDAAPEDAAPSSRASDKGTLSGVITNSRRRLGQAAQVTPPRGMMFLLLGLSGAAIASTAGLAVWIMQREAVSPHAPVAATAMVLPDAHVALSTDASVSTDVNNVVPHVQAVGEEHTTPSANRAVPVQPVVSPPAVPRHSSHQHSHHHGDHSDPSLEQLCCQGRNQVPSSVGALTCPPSRRDPAYSRICGH